MKFNKINALLFGVLGIPTALAANDYTSSESASELESVVVRGKAYRAISEASNSYLRDRVNLGLLGRQNAFTTPITVVNYDETALIDKNPRNMVDALAQTDASVMAFGGESNTLQGIYVRGLQLDARQFSVNGLSGLYSAYSSPTAMIGAAQLIKGASSATVGMDPEGAVGASINIETKKADDEGNRKIGLAWTGQSRWQQSIDVGHRFGEQKQWGVRLNGLYRDGDTERQAFAERNKEAALNIDYRGEAFQAALDATYAKRQTTGGRARIQDIQLFGFQLPAAPDGKVNLAPAWQSQTTEDQSVMANFNWIANDWVAISGGLGHMESRYSGNFAQIKIDQTESGQWTYRNAAVNNQGRFADQGSRPFSFVSRTTSANLKARGYVQTGNISHNWNVATDYVKRSRDHDTATNVRMTYGVKDLDLYAPRLPSAPILPTTLTQGANNSYTAPSLAFSDTLGFFDEKLRLTLGGRYQWIKQENHSSASKYSSKRWSPMLMLAWLPNTQTVVYGNYLEDLEPGAVDETTGEMGQPRVSRQMELGIRKNWGNMVSSVNVYQIQRPTFWRQAGTHQGVTHIAGETQGKEIMRGVELNLYGQFLNQTLRPYFGMSLMRHTLKDSPSYLGVLLNGDQVASPRLMVKTGLEWDTPVLKGLTLNAGLQYYGKSYQDVEKNHRFPAYTLVDAGVKYTHKWRNHQVLNVKLGVENLLNKNYWQVQRGLQDRSFAVVGLPRTFWLKADYSF